jgi:hypothetical protein
MPIPAGLRAALLLAVGRQEGVAGLLGEAASVQAARAWHAFRALPASLPLFLVVQISVAPLAGGMLLRQVAAFVLGWLAYAALSERMAAASGREALWPRFILLWNWCNLVQYLLLGAALVPIVLGVPPLMAQTVWLVAMGWALWLQWSATRLGLGLSGWRAALMVAVDMGLGIVVVRLVAA